MSFGSDASDLLSAHELSTVQDFSALLYDLTGIDASVSQNVLDQIALLFAKLGRPRSPELAHAASAFYGRINQKLRLNASNLDRIYAATAERGETFHYHAKKAIAWAVDTSDRDSYLLALQRYCKDEGIRNSLTSLYEAIPHDETKVRLHAEISKPSKLRKAHERQVAQDVADSAAASLVWSLWPADLLRKHFAPPDGDRVVDEDYMLGLRRLKPAIFARRRSLVIRRISESFDELSDEGYNALREFYTSWIAAEYDALDNHGHLAVILDVADGAASRVWELTADLTLFAERFLQEPLAKAYFRSRDIEQETVKHIPSLDVDAARFDLAVDGFTYRDLFVLYGSEQVVRNLLLVFQKNERDETLIPCPACRCSQIEGNSYPTLGVRSWECRNLLCPERSIYNRGKRYLFKALLSQEAIEVPENEIPVEIVRKWRRDVLPWPGYTEVIEMLVRHYSMRGDAVALLGDLESPNDQLGRYFTNDRPPTKEAADFWHSAFFKRYCLPGTPCIGDPPSESDGSLFGDQSWTVIQGDAASVLADIPSATFDRAVTSPPYYNAREYSQWPNLYCYLYDMLQIHRQVYRTLKPGAIYAFNVFDYFDNERIITFSAMGNRRLALSALFVDLFRRIGFKLYGNVTWDKGDIEGKRSYNAGNFSPFYQAPFNCWEHVLLFQKPTVPGSQATSASTVSCNNKVLRIKPVYKMVRGVNVHGHTAPFPIELPASVLSETPQGSSVLDPFAGSGTTARAALSSGLWAVLVELNPEYCMLAERMTKEHEATIRGVSQEQMLF